MAIPITGSLKVFDTAQRLRVQRTGWVCGHTSQDLATLTARLRYSKNTHVPMQNAPSAAGGIITLFSNNDGAPTIFAPPPPESISEPPASSRP